MSINTTILEFSIYNSVEDNKRILEEMYQLFLAERLGPAYPLEPTEDIEFIGNTIPEEEIQTIKKWKKELQDYLVYYHEKTGRDGFRNERRAIMKKAIMYGVHDTPISQSDIALLTGKQIKMIVEGSQEVFKVFYDYMYNDKNEYREWITWFNPVDFVLSVVIGYIYRFNTLPRNFLIKSIEKEQSRIEEEKVIKENEQKREEIKKSFYPFEENDYQNLTIQNDGSDTRKKQIMDIGPLSRSLSKEGLIKRIILVLYGSDLWITGFMNMISGYKNGKWNDFVEYNSVSFDAMLNPEINKGILNLIEIGKFDIKNKTDRDILKKRAYNMRKFNWKHYEKGPFLSNK